MRMIGIQPGQGTVNIRVETLITSLILHRLTISLTVRSHPMNFEYTIGEEEMLCDGRLKTMRRADDTGIQAGAQLFAVDLGPGKRL